MEDVSSEIRVGKFIVRELSIGAMLPIIDMAASPDDAVRRAFQLELVKRAVSNEDGTPIDVELVPFKNYMKLIPAVLEVNGMGGNKEAGKG